MKRLAVYIIVTTCIVLMYFFPHAMISPGAVSEGHAKTENDCGACHIPFRGVSSEKCISCHKPEDIGKDSLEKDKVLFHEQLRGQECTACHSDHHGRHPDSSWTSFRHELLIADTRSRCSGCHHSPGDNLHGLISAECGSCHNTSCWKNQVLFRHSILPDSALNNCASCHKKPEDKIHSFSMGNCTACHDTSRWKPSTFDHDKYFVLDKDHDVACDKCHNGTSFKDYSCYGCHEHSPAKIREEHMEEGITNFENCVRCHPSANEHDIRTGAKGEFKSEGGNEGEHEKKGRIGDDDRRKIMRYLRK